MLGGILVVCNIDNLLYFSYTKPSNIQDSSRSFFDALWLATTILLWFSLLQRSYRGLVTLSHVLLCFPCPGRFTVRCISTISSFSLEVLFYLTVQKFQKCVLKPFRYTWNCFFIVIFKCPWDNTLAQIIQLFQMHFLSILGIY